MISLNNITVSTHATAGTVVGKLALLNSNLVALSASFILTKSAAGFFTVSGSNLVTVKTLIPPNLYSVKVKAVGVKDWMDDDAVFLITVTAT
jgi:hypothetical protein